MSLSHLGKTIVILVLACVCGRAEPVTVSPQVTGKGVVLGGATVESGTQITLRAVSEVDWRFDHWEGAPSGVANENPVTLTAGAGMQPTAVMVGSDGAGRFAGGQVVTFPLANETPPTTNVPPGLNAIAISAGARNALALEADGTVTKAMTEISALFRAKASPEFQFGEARVVNDQLTVRVTGSAGTTVTLQATEDFVTWTDVKTVTIDSSGGMDVSVEAIAQEETARFYRIREGEEVTSN